MEEDTGALECLILYYIDMKHVLKTKLLDEKVFFHQLLKHCKENGYHSYSGEEIKNTWKKLVSKYLLLKANGSVEEREKWMYFEVLNSCYEESDFHSGVRSKFSEDMLWFLIQCLWKRKSLMKTQKRNCIINEVHKDFLLCGYSHVTKYGIEKQWKYLTMMYGKVKDDPEKLKKLPYLNAIRSFSEGDDHLIDMVFTKELTETLIDLFTKRKIACIIHGYYSDQVLSHIKSKFNDLGFNFSREAIKEKWKALTIIYKFILTRGRDTTAWIYFDAMKNHFKSDQFFSKKDAEKQSSGKRRHLMTRSKSISVEDENIVWDESDAFSGLEKLKFPPSSETTGERDEKICPTGKAPVKRSLASLDQSKPPKKLKTRGRSRKRFHNAGRNSRSGISESQIIGNQNVRCLRSRSKSVNARMDNEIFEQDHSDVKLENTPKKKKVPVKKSVEDFEPSNSDKIQIKSMRNSDALENLEESQSNHTSDEAVPEHGEIFQKDSQNEERRDSTSTTSGTNEVHVMNINQSVIEKENGTLTINLPSITKRVSCNDFLPLKKQLRLDINARAAEGNLSFPAIEIEKQFSTSTNNSLTDEEVTEIVKEIEKDNSVTNQDFPNCFGPEGIKNCQVLYSNLECSKTDKSTQDTSPVKQEKLIMLLMKVNEANKTLKNEDKLDRSKDVNKDTGKIVEDFNVSQSFLDLEKSIGVNGEATIQTKTKQSVPITDVSFVKMNTTHYSGEAILSAADITVPNTSYNSDYFPKEIRPNAMHLTNFNDNVPYTAEENSEVQKWDVSFHTPLPLTEITIPETETLSETEDTVIPQGAGTSHLPPKVPGRLKQIVTSPSALDNSWEVKASVNVPKPSEINSDVSRKQILPGFKFLSQVIKPATVWNPATKKDKKENNREPIDDSFRMKPQTLMANWEFAGTDSSSFQNTSKRKEQFQKDGVFSEALGDDGLRDDLLATVIDFQEQNNQEFLEIKNLMRQNNLLQRETNRLLRLFLEGR